MMQTVGREQANYVRWFWRQDWRRYTPGEQRYHWRQYCLIQGTDPGPRR